MWALAFLHRHELLIILAYTQNSCQIYPQTRLLQESFQTQKKEIPI